MADDITTLIIDLIKEPLTQFLSTAVVSFVSGLGAEKAWSPKVLSDKDFKIDKETTKIEIRDNGNQPYVNVIVTRNFDMKAKVTGKHKFRREIATNTKGKWILFTLNGGAHAVEIKDNIAFSTKKIPFKAGDILKVELQSKETIKIDRAFYFLAISQDSNNIFFQYDLDKCAALKNAFNANKVNLSAFSDELDRIPIQPNTEIEIPQSSTGISYLLTWTL